MNVDVIRGINLGFVKQELLRHADNYPNSVGLYSNKDTFAMTVKELTPKHIAAVKRIYLKIIDEVSSSIMTPFDVRRMAQDMEFLAEKVNESALSKANEYVGHAREKVYA